MIVRREVDFSKPVKLTDEQLRMIENLKKMDDSEIDLSDIPELTEDQLKRLRRVSPERQKRFKS